jgi:undecaprenyl-diphosphatase
LPRWTGDGDIRVATGTLPRMFRAIVLGAVQGLTEFVPVSSSAHLVLVPFLLGWPVPSLAFDVAVHIGTLVALIVYFWRDLWEIVVGVVRTAGGRADDHDRARTRLAWLLLVGSIPAALAGLFLESLFEELFARPGFVAGELVITAILLLTGEAVYARTRPEGRRDVDQVNVADVLIMGALQALAISPGISRSGATITGGLFRGLSREAAARFSFLLSIPAIAGAAVVAVPDLPPGTDWGSVLAATAVAGVTGFAAVAFLLHYLRTRTMRPFAVYCVAFSALSFSVAVAR